MHIETKQFKDVHNSEIQPGYALFSVSWALVTVFILIAAKAYAYWSSGSAAVLATLTDSVVDAGVSLMMFYAVRLSLKPADEDHRYGHGKVEGLAALFQSALMGGAAVFLAFESVQRFAEPRLIGDHLLAGGVAAFAILLSLVVIVVQKIALAKAPSLAIEADHAHYTTDLALNGAVIAALAVDYYSGPRWVDPLAALFVAGYFGLTALKIGRKAVDMLMDKELPDALRTQIRQLAMAHAEVRGAHDLRTRKIGMKIHISLDLEMDPGLTLSQAHDISLEVEKEILQAVPNAEIMIHLDPHGVPHQDSRHALGEPLASTPEQDQS